MKKITIAIDGYSSSGKSTMAKALANRLGYIYVDTGAMYRAVTLFALRSGIINNDGNINEELLNQKIDAINITFNINAESGAIETILNNENVEAAIRTLEVSSKVSLVASLPFVRKFLVRQQQLLGKNKGVVMDGRDIGTVVFPDAELKIFVTASTEVRAKRRYNELKSKGLDVRYSDILNNIQQRDYIDTHRSTSPLIKATDAIELDNSNMTISEQLEWILKQYNKVISD